jgi:uncharacterized membrane protein YeaQ/YmgE (transglycosylase-associated protein family)
MAVSISTIIVWIVVGILAGTLAGMAIKRKKQGFGWLYNLLLGMAGAVIGGFLFNLLNIDFGLSTISISLRDLVSAFVGALLVLAAIHLMRRRSAKKNETTLR